MKTKQTDEEKLLAYWSKRVSKDSDFKRVLEENKRGYILDVLKKEGNKSIDDLNVKLARIILTGWPLTKSEYHAALAFNLLLGEVDYLTFFKTHWHETDDHRGYGSAHYCRICKEKKKKPS